MLPSSTLPPAAYPSSTVTKSAPAEAAENSVEFFQEHQEEVTPMSRKQETAPIKTKGLPPSDSEDSVTEENQEKNQQEKEKSKSTKENIEKLFSAVFKGARRMLRKDRGGKKALFKS